ncbi:MAG: hypothetical protein LCH91_15590 [Bacteroidetes bacterium]|nr:hypothetical protein [Bacteroidota bacterium]
MGDMIFNPWTGEWEVLNPSKTSTNTTNKGGSDWLNTILTGVGNILGGLFPNGVNNGGSSNNGIPGGYFPPTQQSNTSQDNNTIYLLIGLVLVVLLVKK